MLVRPQQKCIRTPFFFPDSRLQIFITFSSKMHCNSSQHLPQEETNKTNVRKLMLNQSWQQKLISTNVEVNKTYFALDYKNWIKQQVAMGWLQVYKG